MKSRLFFISLAFIFSASSLSAVELSFLSGDVSIQRGSSKITKPAPGEKINGNDVVSTGKKSAATVSYPDGSELRLGENSSVKIGEIKGSGDAPAIVVKGNVTTKFTKLAKDSSGKRKVYTPTTICAVRGTEFKVVVSDTAASRVELTEGSLEVYNPEGGSTIEAGTSVEADAAIAPVKSERRTVDADAWAQEKDSEFDADVPEKSGRFKKQTEDFASRGEEKSKKIDKLKREIKEEKDKEALEKKGGEIDKESESIEDDYYLSDASANAIDRIGNRFQKDKADMRKAFEKLKKDSNKVRDQQKRNYLAIKAVKDSYLKALEAIKSKYDADKQNIKGNVDLNKVKPQINK